MRLLFILCFCWSQAVAGGIDLSGTWRGTVPLEAGPTPMVLILEQEKETAVTGILFSHEHMGKLTGRLEATRLTVAIDFGGQVVFEGRLTVDDDVLEGSIYSKALDLTLPITASRSPVAGVAAMGVEAVDLSAPRPQTVYRDALPAALKAPIARRIRRHLEENGIVGMATAVLYEGRIADLRCMGWENAAERVPVTDKTMFRWASISKPLTATAAMQLVESGDLDLERDVREYVPEFPAKPWPVTGRQLLSHHGGLVHYHPGKVVVTERDYEVPHPFSDRILALDKFKESELLFEPGTQFSYSTPGYALLGAVIQRAGKAVYEDQVRTRILNPLGMKEMQPDYPQVTILHRTLGYKKVIDKLVVPSGDSDVSWKLAAGGWISPIGDLARFGAAVLSRELLSPVSWEAMWTPRNGTDDRPGFYGYGFNIAEKADTRIVFHSGAQRKTVTMLMLCPDLKLGVAIMSNTEGVRHESLSFDLIEILTGQ